MKDNFIQISEKQFYNYFSDDRYVRFFWAGKNSNFPEPPYWMAHNDWVFDTLTQTYVGYELSSSWNDNVEYGILESIATAEMISWNARLLVVQKWRKEKVYREYLDNAEYWGKRFKPFDPAKPGLFDFPEKEATVVYFNPENFSIDFMLKQIEDIWVNQKIKRLEKLKEQGICPKCEGSGSFYDSGDGHKGAGLYPCDCKNNVNNLTNNKN